MLDEVFKDIEGYVGLYKIGDKGTVLSLRGANPKPIYQTTTNCGYKQVRLSKNGLAQRFGVHVLVAQAFVSGWFEGAEVNHKDLDKQNNEAINLEWVTHRENQKHQYHIRHPESKKWKCCVCGKQLASPYARFCEECLIDKRHSGWPSKEDLEKEILMYSIEKIGSIHGVTGNAIRKMLRFYRLPVYKKDILKIREISQ